MEIVFCPLLLSSQTRQIWVQKEKKTTERDERLHEEEEDTGLFLFSSQLFLWSSQFFFWNTTERWKIRDETERWEIEITGGTIKDWSEFVTVVSSRERLSPLQPNSNPTVPRTTTHHRSKTTTVRFTPVINPCFRLGFPFVSVLGFGLGRLQWGFWFVSGLVFWLGLLRLGFDLLHCLCI